MDQTPPVVSFDKPINPLQVLRAQRQKLQMIIRDYEAGIRDIDKIEGEGVWYANVATTWAVVLLTTDVLRETLSRLDRRASLLFKAQDKAIGRAEKIMKAFGQGGFAKRGDVLKTVDPELQNAVRLIDSVSSARDFLQKAKVEAPKKAEKLLDIGTTLAQDAVIIMQGLRTGQNVHGQAEAQRRQMRDAIRKLQTRIRVLDQEYTRLFLEAEVRSRTA